MNDEVLQLPAVTWQGAAVAAGVLAARRRNSGLTLADKLVGYLPRYAPTAARLAWLMNLRNKIGPVRKLTEKLTGVSHRRDLPVWSSNPFRDDEAQDADPDVLLFADVFNRYFEPENLRAAIRTEAPVWPASDDLRPPAPPLSRLEAAL